MSAVDVVECVPQYTVPDLELGLKEGRTQHTYVCVSGEHLATIASIPRLQHVWSFIQPAMRYGPCFMGRTEGRRETESVLRKRQNKVDPVPLTTYLLDFLLGGRRELMALNG